jgi:hypothetical protein
VAEFQFRYNHRENADILFYRDSSLLRHGHWLSQLETNVANDPESKQLELPF